tara:strand:- start:29 stop:421 length:393 start_codon:yes stop_codon:yes gene_type:complete
MRLTLIVRSIEAFNFQMLLFGYGIINFFITEIGAQKLAPHVELLRHMMELGMFGFLIAFSIYSAPFLKSPPNEKEQFFKLFLLSSLVITFAQPSGPVTHLNSAIVFWMVHASQFKLLLDENNFEVRNNEG